MGKEPENILLLKRKNDELAAARHHAHAIMEATTRAKWFSDDFKHLGKSELTADSSDFVKRETVFIQRHEVSLRDQITQVRLNNGPSSVVVLVDVSFRPPQNLFCWLWKIIFT